MYLWAKIPCLTQLVLPHLASSEYVECLYL